MRRISTSGILTALLVASWIGFLASSPKAQERHLLNDKWEYKTAKEINDELSDAGQRGWEAYAVIRLEAGSAPTYYLKRRIN